MTRDEFAVEALRRLPVAEAILSVFAVICSQQRMDDLYSVHRGRSYQGLLSFHRLVELMTSAILEHDGVARPALLDSRKAGQLPVSDQAAYGKIRRMPTALSHALLSESIAALMELFPDRTITQVPACFNKYHVYGIDGKKLKDVAKRLKETRGTPGKLLGGKALVAHCLHHRIVVAFNSTLDGEANDGPLVPGLLESVHTWTPGMNLFLADSQFCDLTTPRRILEYRSDFIVRYHPKVHFHIDPEISRASGVDSRGRPWVEAIGWLGQPGTKRSIRVRQIVVSRQDKPDLVIVTSLLDCDNFGAADILDLYALRWTIETVFQHITEQFDLRRMIGSTAQATIFQFSISLLIYNFMILIQTRVSEHRELDPQQLSLPKIIKTVKKQLLALSTFVPASTITTEILNQRPTPLRVSNRVRKLWNDDWIKAIKNKRKTKPPPAKRAGAHTSVKRLIDAYHNQ